MVDKTDDASVTTQPSPAPVAGIPSTSGKSASAGIDVSLLAPVQQSWGEKYKDKAYSFVRNWVVNYAVNFTEAAALTFAFDTSKLGAKFRDWSDRKTDQYKHIVSPALSGFIIKFATRTQLLLCGGHTLQPALKWMRDHRKRMEFRLGHDLDLLQEMTGHGNTASKLSIEEYHRVSSLVAIGDKNAKERDSSNPIPALSEIDKELLIKNGIDEQLHFKERKMPWSAVLKARVKGIVAATGTGIVMALASSQKVPEGMRFEESFEEPVGKWVGNKVVARIPVVSWLFRKEQAMPGQALSGHELIGKYFVDDAILTMASKIGYDRAEAAHDKKVAEEEARTENVIDAKLDLQRRAAILRDTPTDFRTREDKRSLETSLALS